MPYSMAVYPFPSFAFLAPPRVAFWSGLEWIRRFRGRD